MKLAGGAEFYRTNMSQPEALQWLENQIPQFMMKADEKNGKLEVDLTFHMSASKGNQVLDTDKNLVPSTTKVTNMISVLNVMNAHRTGSRLLRAYRWLAHSL